MINKYSNVPTDDYSALQWRQIGLNHKKTDKAVLENLSGKINSGNFLTIMGPFGAGKTSLLSILTFKMHYKKQFSMTGTVTINQQTVTPSQFSKIAAYVGQDDLLFGTLTVRGRNGLKQKLFCSMGG